MNPWWLLVSFAAGLGIGLLYRWVEAVGWSLHCLQLQGEYETQIDALSNAMYKKDSLHE